jgi:hypothetical protein
MKKILCAVDESEHANSAAALAAQMAKAMGAELTLLAVNELEGIEVSTTCGTTQNSNLS